MRKIFTLALCLILLLCLTVPASASAARTFLLQEYDVVGSEVRCYGKYLPTGGQLEVSDGARMINNVSCSTLEQEHIPVTLYCLVDSSTSQSDRIAKQREDMLLTFSSMMAEEDSMVLATIDAILTESKPMTTREARDTAIRTISGQVWYTNLYDGISQALKTLHTSTAYHTNRCLVILSDGHDDGKSTATGEEIQKLIQEAGIPVYTVILNTGNSTEKELTQQRNFAEESLGGFLSFPDEEGISSSAAAQKIWNNIKNALAIRIGVEDLQNTGSDQQILIRYHAADARYEDTILIRAVDLPVIPAETSPETTEESTGETTEPSGGTDEEPGLSKKELVIGCCIGIALLGAGIAAFFLTRKDKHNEIVSDPGFVPAPESEPETDPTPVTDPFWNPHPDGPIDITIPVEPQCHVTAIAIMHPEVTADFYLTRNKEATFGRNSNADILLNPNDKKLSGCHGCFFWNGELLLVQDRDSKNGTAVNSEFCSSQVWLPLADGDILTAGSYKYRIHIQDSNP